MNFILALRRRFLPLALLAVSIGLMLAPEPLYARAGGGGGYSGGGGGSSGGFSGGGGYSGGGGASLTWKETLVVIGIVAFVGILAALQEDGLVDGAQGGLSGSSEGDDSALPPGTHESVLTALWNVDPGFDATEFCARFKDAFVQIQAAWQKQDMSSVQHYISDGIFERFTLQIMEQKDMGYRDHMERIRVDEVDLAEFTANQVFEVLTVRVKAVAVDYRVSIQTGQYLSGNRTPTRFVEFWSFIRRRGTQTSTSNPGLIEGHCPNCRTPIQMNQMGQCASCASLLRNGEYDWVLSEITQACEWRPFSSGVASGLSYYQTRYDPGFNLQHLEDRASVIFWRKAMADRLGTVKPLKKIATQSFCEILRLQYEQQNRDPVRYYRGNCAVGSVEFLGIVQENAYDYVLVEVRWASLRHSVTENGSVKNLESWQRSRSLHVLTRRQGVTTNVSRSVHSAHCPACGAPESHLESHACDSCGVALNTGEQDWILADFDSMNGPTAKSWLSKLTEARPAIEPSELSTQNTNSSISHLDRLAWLVSLLTADGEIQDEERAALSSLANKHEIPDTVVEGLIASALRGELDMPRPTNGATAKAWLEQMADFALADGVVQPSEIAVMQHLGRELGWAFVDINLLINKRRVKQRRRGN